MSNVTLNEVIELADQLQERDRAVLLAHLQVELAAAEEDVTRESLMAEHARLKASGAFDHVESLADRYARPELRLTEEELNTILHEARTEWEAEIDEFFSDD